jgi:hypothetical protein
MTTDSQSAIDQDSCSADAIALLAAGRFHDALPPLRMALQLGDMRPLRRSIWQLPRIVREAGITPAD